jgi:dienelactone hydrolase
MINTIVHLLILLLFNSCITSQKTTAVAHNKPVYQVQRDTFHVFDASRKRVILLAVFQPKTDQPLPNQPVVLYSHGYRYNQPGGYLTHATLATFLASKGYLVICIQHENPTDSILPLEGIPKIVRRTNWERGAANILFVREACKKTYPTADFDHLTLIGASNGGDMSMLFAQKYPNLLDKIISLDNRRCDFPRTSRPKIYSLRSSDQVADAGVLPTLEEQKKYGMTIIALKNTIHNKMNDDANPRQRNEMNTYLLAFLKE